MFKKSLHNYLSSPTSYFLVWLSIIVLFISLQYYLRGYNQVDNLGADFEQAIKHEIQTLEKETETVYSILATQGQGGNYWNTIDKQFSNNEHLIFVYENDNLIYWNNNSLSRDIGYFQIENIKLIENQTGCFLIKSSKKNELQVLIAIQLKSKLNSPEKLNSSHQNISWYSLDNLDFTIDPSVADYCIYSEGDEFMFGLKYINEENIGIKWIIVLFVLYILGYIFILLWMLKLYEKSKRVIKNQVVLLLFLVVDIIILRLIDYYIHIPGILKGSQIFEEQFNIFPLFNSSGDILINAILFLIIAFQIYNLLANRKWKKTGTVLMQLFSSLLLWGLISLVFIFIFKVILQLPFSSFYGFDIDSLDTIFIFISTVFGVFSLSVLFEAIANNGVNQLGKRILIFVLSGLAILIPLILINPINIDLLIITGCIILLMYITYQYLHKYQNQQYFKYLTIIILISIATTVIINSARNTKKNLNQYSTLRGLASTNDKELENTFEKFEKAIQKDSLLKETVSNDYLGSKSAIMDYLIETYFKEIAKKYDIQITICADEDMLELQPEGYVVACSDYFENYMIDSSNIMISNNLFLIPEKPESTYYFGKQQIRLAESDINIYLEFYFTYIPAGLGYPELLVSEAAMDIDLSGYSFASYKNDQLVYKYGDFPYYTSLQNMEPYQPDKLFNMYNYSHIKHEFPENSFLIISRPNDKLAVQMVSFSALFILFITFIVLVSIVLFGKQAANLLRSSFQSRLQIIFVSAISAIILLLASITLFYINLDNQNRLAEHLTEKTNSVIVELQHKLSAIDDLYSIDPLELQTLLQKFSLVFFSDINLYSPSGELISTSRPEIFNRGLLSENINPQAYKEIFINDKLFFITYEKLGSVTYYSAYAPLMLSGDKAVGIINLPYFARQSEVSRSYYQMIFTFINLFVILGIIGTVMVLMLSRLITKPLVVLQKSLSEIQIDKRNEIIKWKGNDEIGQLIRGYNQMIVKLEESTELLKQSERESAWREVAQQIAHEIKNPLTPMKLNVQYLEKAFREKDPGLEEKVKNISEMLIAQIETLNKVAEMFSDFTKTKSRKFESVELSSVIRKAIQLFKNHSDTVFIFNEDIGSTFYTKAFEKDLLRVFNNLIKNSIQSMGNQPEPVINIKLSTVENQHLVEFIDNGKGISEDIKTNIFKPYFTTKSTGTGLGLAIVKNIMKEIGGEILLETTTGAGTRFVLYFPSINE